MSQGLFITLEGIDGAGKTTQWNLLKSKLEINNNWLFTKNPGGTSLGMKLREILLHEVSIPVTKLTELLLYMADRSQHIDEVIKPALECGKLVVCDRFIDSSIAYQGYGHQMSVDLIKTLNGIATQQITPDLTILLDIEPQKGLQRIGTPDKIEQRGVDFLQRVRDGFLQIAIDNPNRVKIVSIENKSVEQIQSEIHNLISSAMKD